MKWVNLIGLILQFLAFWFAAPELLGKSTLERFESGLKRFVANLPSIIILSFALIYAFGTSGYGIYTGLKGAESGLEEGELFSYFITLGIVFIVYFIFILFSKRIRRWMGNRITDPLIDRLINKNESRQQALIVGATLFSIGFLLQVIAVILG